MSARSGLAVGVVRINMPLKRNVLIFHAGALGDFVLSWPLAMAAGRLFAQSRVFYVAAGQKGQLADKALRLESSDQETGWSSLFADSAELPPMQAKLLAGAHMVVSFVAEAGSTWERNVRNAFGDGELLFLRPHPPEEFAGHHTDFLVQQLSPSVVWRQGVQQMVTSVQQRGLGHLPQSSGPVILHPGSGANRKCWPLERFIELATLLQSSGRAVRFVVGDVERDRWDAGVFDRLRGVAELRSCQTLVELWTTLLEASAFVGNDSGPGHLAGIAGLPTVSLFGSTDVTRWKPLGPRVRVVQGALESMSAAEAFQAVSAVVG